MKALLCFRYSVFPLITLKSLYVNKPRLYGLFRFIIAAYIVKCTATRYRRYKDRLEYIISIQLP